MFLESPRLYLREVRLSDVNDNYYQWMNDPEMTKYMEIRFKPQSMEEIRNYVEMRAGNQDEPFFAIAIKGSNCADEWGHVQDIPPCHIGNIKLGPVNWIHRSADVSLFIGYRHLWGRGYATEAIQLVSDYAFKKLNLCKLKAGIYAENFGSYSAFKKAGFSIEGRLKKQVFCDGKRQDVILLGKVNE